MAYNGKARRAGIIKTKQEDGALAGVVSYSMLTPVPAGFQTPNGFVPVTRATLAGWSTGDYKAQLTAFLTAVGVPQLQQSVLLSMAEFDESTCTV